MIESTLINYLESQLGDIPVFAEMPEDSNLGRVVIVDKTGGGSVGKGVYTATLAIMCFADTRAEAAKLAYSVRDAMDGFDSLTEIGSCDLNAGPYNFPYVDNKHQRYQIVYNIVHY